MTIRRAVLLLILFASGCGVLSPKKSRIYSIEPLAPASGSIVAARGLPVGIDGVELPPGLDRKDIVVRRADHQLDVRGTEQWSATLGPLVLHTIAVDLARRLPDGMVILPGQSKPLSPMRSIDLAFEELAAGPEPRLILDVQWVLHVPGRSDETNHERISVDLPALDSASVASGTSAALAALADRIAAKL